MLSKNELNVGDKLIAVDVCTMRTSLEYSLTIGNEYEIIAFDREDNEDCILIIDDQGDEHLYPISELEKWFNVG
jgi:hypothetical protein